MDQPFSFLFVKSQARRFLLFRTPGPVFREGYSSGLTAGLPGSLLSSLLIPSPHYFLSKRSTARPLINLLTLTLFSLQWVLILSDRLEGILIANFTAGSKEGFLWFSAFLPLYNGGRLFLVC
jgi:hypothetical protein